MQNPLAMTLEDVAKHLGCQLDGDSQHIVDNIADLQLAQSSDLVFYSNTKYRRALEETKAGAILVGRAVPGVSGKNILIAQNLPDAIESAIALFRRAISSGFTHIHPTAVLHPTVKLGTDVHIGPLCTIDRDVVIGSNTAIMAGVHIGPECVIGDHCQLFSNVVVREGCRLGSRVVLQPGAVIGSCGFGFTSTSRGHQKQAQLGRVVIEDDVEVGALSSIDRARFTSTHIGRGTKIDNLVQIAHGVQIGACNLVVAQSGFAGSSSTGNWVTFAGQSALGGHVHITDRVTLAARTGVTKNIVDAGIYAGFPAVPIKQWRRQVIHLKHLPQLVAFAKSLQLPQRH